MRHELNLFIATNVGWTQSKIANAIGKSPATVNQYLQGKYKGKRAEIDALVAQFLQRQRTKKHETRLTFVETETAMKIQRLVSVTHANGDIQLVIGEAGLGKTVALKHYAQHHADVVMIDVEPTFNAKVLLTAICNTINIEPSRTNHEMMVSIVKKLNDSGRLLIIDEAELLQHKPLEILRRIHDLSGVGIVLAGMPRLRANLRGKRGEYKQLYSRVGFCYDIGAELNETDISVIAESALGTAQHNPTLIAAAQGNARRLSKLIRGVQRYADDSGEPIDTPMINQFANMLIS